MILLHAVQKAEDVLEIALLIEKFPTPGLPLNQPVVQCSVRQHDAWTPKFVGKRLYASLFISDYDYDFAYGLAVDEDIQSVDVVFEGEFLGDEGFEFSG